MDYHALIPLLSLAALLASCQLQHQDQQGTEQKEAPPKKAPLYLGTVHQVYPEKDFALLRLIGPIPKEDTTVITHPANGTHDRIGNLIISSGQAARNGIIAADIRSGTVVQGDLVFLYRNIAAPEAREEETEEAPPQTEPNQDQTIIESPPASLLTTETLEPEPSTSTPDSEATLPLPESEPTSPSKENVPSYLNDIPDDISKWDNM